MQQLQNENDVSAKNNKAIANKTAGDSQTVTNNGLLICIAAKPYPFPSRAVGIWCSRTLFQNVRV
jgi:hypothetical protein